MQSVVCVVSHDAGGAEVISAWVRKNPENRYLFLLDGPAIVVFRRKLGDFANHEFVELNRLIQQSDFVLTGTSWGSDIEKHAIRVAKENAVKVASFLDHWSKYPERFSLDGRQVLPDEIWVGDDDAYRLARTCFEGQAIRLVTNPYFLDVEEAFAQHGAASRNGGGCRILYVCEAIAESGVRSPSGEPIEYRCMDLFFGHLRSIVTDEDMVTVRLRQHPAESVGKYAAYLDTSGPIKVELSEGTTLIEDCIWADQVVGMGSMALIVARIGGKQVYYCNIDGAPPKSLPLSGLENFLDIKHLR